MKNSNFGVRLGGTRDGKTPNLAHCGLLRVKRAGVFVALALLITMTTACPNWELAAYRSFAVAQVNYEKGFAAIVELHERGLVSDADYARGKQIADRIYRLGKNGTALLVRYAELKDAATKRDIQAAVVQLPGLTLELAAFLDAVKGKSAAPPPDFSEQLEEKLGGIEQRLDVVEVLEQ